VQLSDEQPKITVVWAKDAISPYITYPVPTPSQVSVEDGAASFTTGFVPLNFVPRTLGGTGPFGKDFNGLSKQVTAELQWIQAGGAYRYDGAFSTAIGGYPHKAMLQSATSDAKLWFSIIDNNTDNPDTAPGNWRTIRTPPTADLLGGFSNDYVEVTVGTGLGITNTPDDEHRTLAWDPPDPVTGLNSNFFFAGSHTVIVRAKATKVTLIAGGGGCGSGGGGGGAGGQMFWWITGMTPGLTLNLVVGAGGAGGASPQAGGDTILGSGTQVIPGSSTVFGGQPGTGGNGGSGGGLSAGDGNAFGSIGNGGDAGFPATGGITTLFGTQFGSGGGATAGSDPLIGSPGIAVFEWIN
jgi:hypothetical protein